MKSLMALLCVVLFVMSCSKDVEGLLGEWEGKTEVFDANMNLVESDISCKISTVSALERNLILEVKGKVYNFNATENDNILTYKDKQLNQDSVDIMYISGMAELRHDTLLHFEHRIYTLRKNALLNSEMMDLEMTRKD